MSLLACFPQHSKPHRQPSQNQTCRQSSRAQLLEPSTGSAEGMRTQFASLSHRFVKQLPYADLSHYYAQWSKANNLLLEAYSPLGSTDQVKKSLNVPQVPYILIYLSDCYSPLWLTRLMFWNATRWRKFPKRSESRLRRWLYPGSPNAASSSFRKVSRLQEFRKISRVCSFMLCYILAYFWEYYTVYELPQDLFKKLERASVAHPPHRVVNPSKGWGLGYDIFDDYPY